jgi:hypothetical protein
MTDTPFQSYHTTKLDNHKYWSQEDPSAMDDLQTFLDGLYGGMNERDDWTNWFRGRLDQLLNASSRGDVAFVDVAGGRGPETEKVLGVLKCEGRFVLQDLPEVLKDIQGLNPRIEKMPYDFLTPQPIKGIDILNKSFGSTKINSTELGCCLTYFLFIPIFLSLSWAWASPIHTHDWLETAAKVYFLSNILHDHPDPVCHQILHNLASAMDTEHSTILISNLIMPDETDDVEQPTRTLLDMDLTMLVLSGGAQRTKKEWTSLISAVEIDGGKLQIAKFWPNPGRGNAIIEVKLA